MARAIPQAVALPGDPSKDPLRTNAAPFVAADFSYSALRKLGDLQGKAPTQPRISAEVKIETEQQIFEFLIHFEPNELAHRVPLGLRIWAS